MSFDDTDTAEDMPLETFDMTSAAYQAEKLGVDIRTVSALMSAID